MDSFDMGRVTYLILLLAFVGGWVIVEFRGRMGSALRIAMAWGLIFLAVAAGYGLWTEMAPTLSPRQEALEGGEISIPRAPDGHYYITLQIEGTDIRFMADTGASSVLLSARDARRLGIDPDSLIYLGTARTANGEVRTARVLLTDVRLGEITDLTLPALVNEGDLDISLLGMSYLRRFDISISGDRMILRR
ncbi:TIGR02281 family clan AA aspartic protease [Falsirhodobacter algicola]|uniref:TIGR02281 family clan AA aspartic protease n=1 Tax=Falsirhodobacter algicola TaxID=2692330 RepID=A0A8J8MSK3_9RHOB|nr:TIGR02281 family clan AA aspartic protease [Falsirhodobacter algicola]QUS35616.1 TIGR02281 family clan AA aspartic protease [Falsirhodobacter algicola]